MKDGFITLLGLLLVTLILGILFVRTYSSSGTKKTQMETYTESIDKAEDVKRMIEGRNSGY